MRFPRAYSGVSGHTDIRTEGWVARLPAPWRPYALLMRLDRPIGSWLLFLPGPWAFAMVAPSWAEGLRLLVLFGIGSVIGMAVLSAMIALPLTWTAQSLMLGNRALQAAIGIATIVIGLGVVHETFRGALGIA